MEAFLKIKKPDLSKSAKVVNVKKDELSKQGYKDIQDWLKNPNNVYIGRAMNYPNLKVPQSKWGNPFPVQKHGRDECIKMYEQYVRNGELSKSLDELKGKTLGCWCHPEPCHGHVLVRLIEEKEKAKENEGEKLEN